MSDNTPLSAPVGSGDTIRDKDRAGVKTQIVGLDLTPAGGSETLMNGSMPVTDNSGSLTVDAPVGTPVFVRLSDGSTAIATLPVSLASLPATAADGAALPAVVIAVGGFDGTNLQALVTDSTGRLVLAPTTQAGATVKTSDYDSGAGTDTVAMQGIALPASGGAVQGGTGTNPVRTDPTGTTAQPITDNGGSITVDGTVTANLGTAAVTNAGTFAVQIAANSSVNNAQVAGTATSVNSGTKDAGTQRVILASDQTVVPISDNSGSLTVDNAGTFAVQDSEKIADDAAFTVGTTKVQPVGYLADQASTDSVNEGDIGAARMTLDRKQIFTAAPSADTEGWDTKNCTAGDGSTALTNTAQAIKASAGKLGGWFIYNPNATAAYVPIYNVASGSVTVGTTNPQMVLTIPATSAANLEMVCGLAFDTAISVAAATTAAGNTAPGTALEANFFFK